MGRRKMGQTDKESIGKGSQREPKHKAMLGWGPHETEQHCQREYTSNLYQYSNFMTNMYVRIKKKKHAHTRLTKTLEITLDFFPFLTLSLSNSTIELLSAQ